MSENTGLRYHNPLFILLTGSILISINLCINSFCASAQEDSVIRQITAQLAESLPEATDLSQLTERLSFYRQHPIELNHAKPEQFKELVFISALQISNFFSHLKLSGPLKDVLELQAIDGFDIETVNLLTPFVTLKPDKGYTGLSLKKLLNHGENEVLLRYGQTLEKQKGFRDLPGSRYLGSPQKLLVKYKYNYSDVLAVSFLADKDAGERLSGKTGFDFLSGSIALYKTGRFRKIILGDYSLQFGQGLTLWSGTSFGKGPDVAGVAKKDTGLKPYTSTGESTFFRGLGSVFKLFRYIDITTFISIRSLDASLTKDTTGNSTLSAISTSGLHRTKTEVLNKGALGQALYGTAIEFSKTGFDAGITAYHSSYQYPFVTGSQRYKRYAFYGKELTNLGIHYNYTFKNSYLFGEFAQSDPGGSALLNGIMASITPVLSAVLVYRNYSMNHMNFYSQALGNSSSASNETGIYGGLHFTVKKKWVSSFYFDLFQSPWAKYRVDTASSGYELMGQLSYVPGKTFKATLKVSSKQTEQNDGSALPVNPIVRVSKKNYRLEVHWKLNSKTGMANRVEITQYSKGSLPVSYGYMIYQDADFSPMSAKVSANIRVAFFNTPSYENRVYAYEDDVLYGAGSGLYNGKGIRTFLNLSYRLTKQLRVWGRYAIYLYPGAQSIGSALDEINGNQKSDIRLQLRYQF